MSSVKVRLPPSPTGYCHVGTARMALLNYLFARKNNGTIVFRSEDTDRARSTKEYEDDIIARLKWLGLSWDEFYRQSERTATYSAAIEQLIAADKAYVSHEPSRSDPSVMADVIRLRNPGTTITFDDIVRGTISFDTAELKDFVIARAIDDPIYHLTVVVDDAQMDVTHVIRGEEHISNTPRQILIQEALGYPRPRYAHYPLFLGTDRSKLSKRKGDVAMRDYENKGFLPAAMLNFIGTLGWTPPSGREVLSLDEMVAEFDLSDLHKSGAVFNVEKLRWYNRTYLLELSTDAFFEYVHPVLRNALEKRSIPWSEDVTRRIVPIIKERISVASDVEDAATAGEYDFFFTEPTLDPAAIPGKKSTSATAVEHLSAVRSIFDEAAPDAFTDPESVKMLIWEYANSAGRAAVLWPLRYALSGLERSPDPFIIASVIGKGASIRRLDAALALL